MSPGLKQKQAGYLEDLLLYRRYRCCICGRKSINDHSVLDDLGERNAWFGLTVQYPLEIGYLYSPIR